MSRWNLVLPAVGLVGLVGLVVVMVLSAMTINDMKETAALIQETKDLSFELRVSSDDLTRFIRTYTVTNNESYWEYFQHVLNIRNGREPLPTLPSFIYWDLYIAQGGPPRPFQAPRSLQDRMKAARFTEAELELLSLAQARSDALIDLEDVAYHAMKGLYRPGNGSKEFSVRGEPNQTLAMELVHGTDYHIFKGGIMAPILDFSVMSSQRVSDEMDRLSLNGLVMIVCEGFLVVLFLILMLLFTITTRATIRSQQNELRAREEYDKACGALSLANDLAMAIRRLDIDSLLVLNDYENRTELQETFLGIALMLQQIRSYIPASVVATIVNGGSDDESQADSEAANKSHTGSRSSNLNTHQSESSGMTSVVRATPALHHIDGLVSKRFTIAYVHKPSLLLLTGSGVSDTAKELLEMLIPMAEHHGGVVHLGDSCDLYFSFNASKSVALHLAGALSFAGSVKQTVSSLVEDIRIGIASSSTSDGLDRCGIVGAGKVRGYSIVGPARWLAQSVAHNVTETVGASVVLAYSPNSVLEVPTVSLRLLDLGIFWNGLVALWKVHSVTNIKSEWMYDFDESWTIYNKARLSWLLLSLQTNKPPMKSYPFRLRNTKFGGFEGLLDHITSKYTECKLGNTKELIGRIPDCIDGEITAPTREMMSTTLAAPPVYIMGCAFTGVSFMPHTTTTDQSPSE